MTALLPPPPTPITFITQGETFVGPPTADSAVVEEGRLEDHLKVEINGSLIDDEGDGDIDGVEGRENDRQEDEDEMVGSRDEEGVQRAPRRRKPLEVVTRRARIVAINIVIISLARGRFCF